MSGASSASRAVFVLAASLGLSCLLVGSQSELIGHWDGTMVREGARPEVSFDFTKSGSQLVGTFTSPSQQAMDYPLAAVTANGDMVHFVLGDSLVFDGKLGTNDITGTFTDDDAKGEFTFHRAVRTILPYDSVDITFNDGAVRLAGTLCIPRSSGRHPAIVILQGSGGETRWGTNRFIADRFARLGIAALVYDKRGSGASTGDWKSSSYDDLARDALAGIDLLASRPDIDPKRIGLHGHSEGGIIAPIAAVQAPTKVAFIVAEDAVAGMVRDQDVYKTHTSHPSRVRTDRRDARKSPNRNPRTQTRTCTCPAPSLAPRNTPALKDPYTVLLQQIRLDAVFPKIGPILIKETTRPPRGLRIHTEDITIKNRA